MQNRLDGKLVLLYTLLVLQVFIVMIYVIATPPSEYTQLTPRNPVSFVRMEPAYIPQKFENRTSKPSISHPAYQIITSELKLKDTKTSSFFITQNTTRCWKEGIIFNKSHTFSNKCHCQSGWHGPDCGQPEVVWRAIMASKQNIRLKPRKTSRRLIYTFSVQDYNSAIAEVIVEELHHVVDLFVICDFSGAEDNLQHKLNKGLLSNHQHKMLYINAAHKSRKPLRVISKYVWDKIINVVKNMKEDDIYVMSGPEQILNWRALMFLKVYDGWPQPIGFRLRWSVFGFFWQHPSKTIITVGACTVGCIYQSYRTNSIFLQRELGETNERDVLGLVIGDLNHYGGWYCNYCETPANIMIALKKDGKPKEAKYAKNMDVLFVEDLIGTGVWFDDKMSLIRAYKTKESYFAPETVIDNSFKFDWLVDNFYAKLDYY
ncbi:beta-1,4-mannosyl-glycoprotein 4-beta-N-acetylglucosaminyltransferase [Fopius arisanus]|uniref:Beta-1,4-mannosyl-glycoprotein 4-beta-N-acetylglucosaminyltransferase n=1 Tax=Fopius arisanus TaxID=64838 RepID=A0A0C9RS82_9HYME|nr:PREDICTED: beta-1,4-mannosyl-glycoprotein 4-beta-N-acetylglucosaminyltransferase [Fopius arisanus]XP_011314643.1 PREDICTED: beta-1,4-mannosyl-glycoprotein 4-beta-N-acetylglucosaminyltransferase [Fopius arisanus]